MKLDEALSICAEAAELRAEMWQEVADGGFLTGSAVMDCFAEADGDEALSMAGRLAEAIVRVRAFSKDYDFLGNRSGLDILMDAMPPPDGPDLTLPNNEHRVERAVAALASHLEDSHVERSALIDLLTDLMHYAHDRGFDFPEVATMAEIHFDEEVDDEI